MRFIAIFSVASGVRARSPRPRPRRRASSSLEQQLSALVASKSADVGIAALDLNTGETVSIKGNTPFPMASTVKVAVAALYLAQVDHGRRSLDDTINGQSARSLMARMLIHSDNRATDMLFKDLGGPDRGPRLAAGQWRPRASRRPHHRAAAERQARPVGPPRFEHARWRWSTCCRRIYKAELIKPESRNYLLDLMAQCQTGKNRMKALLPSGTPVEHKTGTLDGLADDVGFITMPDGRRIAVAIFTRGGTDRPRTIAETARAIYDGFKSVFTWPFGGPRSPPNSAAAHRCARQDRPLSGGRAGRPLSEADRLADEGDRASRPRRQGARPLPANSVTDRARRARARRCRRSSLRRSSKAGATAASARRAS